MSTIRTSSRKGASTVSAVRPRTDREIDLIENWRTVDKSTLSAQETAFARDSYDDCIADLDEQLGRLLDELERRGVLESTWLIITSDHGESFGEQPGVFVHGTSLYQPQLHVPLVIVPPSGSPRPSRPVVSETVSLRDLPATVVDLLDLEAGAPFPGASLARLWDSTALGGHGRSAGFPAVAGALRGGPDRPSRPGPGETARESTGVGVAGRRGFDLHPDPPGRFPPRRAVRLARGCPPVAQPRP